MKKCTLCKGWKEFNMYSIKDHTTMGRSKICKSCAPHQLDVPVPERAVIYICGFYSEEFNQRYLKVGYTTKSAEYRLRAILKSWSTKLEEIPYSRVLLEIEVDPLNSYNIEQSILKKLKSIYQDSILHNGLDIAGRKETFTVNSTTESRLFVEYVRKLIILAGSEDH